MKELTEQEANELRIVANEIFEELIEGGAYAVDKYRAVAVIETKFLSLLSKDQTKEEMNQAIEEAKNEDISPEITSAFEPVVGAEEIANFAVNRETISEEGRPILKNTLKKMIEGFSSQVAAKMAREKIGKIHVGSVKDGDLYIPKKVLAYCLPKHDGKRPLFPDETDRCEAFMDGAKWAIKELKNKLK